MKKEFIKEINNFDELDLINININYYFLYLLEIMVLAKGALLLFILIYCFL